jgi:hypothetical protein
LCFHMSGPRDWDTTRRARRVIGWRRGQGANSQTQAGEASHQHMLSAHRHSSSSCCRRRLSTPKSLTEAALQATPGTAPQGTRYFRTDSLALPLTSPHLMHPAAAAAARTRTAGRTTGFCQLPALGPVRLAARARSISHHLHLCDAIRICKLNNKPLSLRQCAPASQTQSHACCNLIAAGSSLARRFARSLQIHPYYYRALLHPWMPPCFCRVLLLSPPRFLLRLAD